MRNACLPPFWSSLATTVFAEGYLSTAYGKRVPTPSHADDFKISMRKKVDQTGMSIIPNSSTMTVSTLTTLTNKIKIVLKHKTLILLVNRY